MENNVYMPKAHKIVNITKQQDIEWLFEVEYDLDCRGGQFVEISLPKIGEAPISITKVDKDKKTIELLIRNAGKVTDELFGLEIGDSMFIRGPFGNGFDLDSMEGKDVVVICGGSALAPVREIINKFYKNENCRLLVGFKDEDAVLFKNDLENWRAVNKNIHITLDGQNDTYLSGFVTDHLDMILDGINKDNCVIVVVGPPPMMKFTTMGLMERGIKDTDIQVSFERKMSCGVGKCGHCKIDDTYVCIDGPVFTYDQARNLID